MPSLRQLGIKDLDQLPDDAREECDDAYAALWKDPSRMPARRYRIQVTDPSFVSHIATGDQVVVGVVPSAPSHATRPVPRGVFIRRDTGPRGVRIRCGRARR